MKPTIDIHCHTIASGHAYNTIDEMAASAKKNNLKLIAITDHTPAMPGGAHIFHFHNLRVLPEYIEGVRVLKGAEVNILPEGKLDLNDETLSQLEISIASLHIPCFKPVDKAAHSAALIGVMKNRYINIIGHPGDMRFDFDISAVVTQAKDTGTLLEINNNSLKPGSFRVGGATMITEILLECKRQNAKVIIGSDAHYKDAVGIFDESFNLFKEINFPQSLLVNDPEMLMQIIANKRKS